MIKQGQRLQGTINNVASFGVFVTLDDKHHGLIKRQELDYGKMMTGKCIMMLVK